MIFQRVATLLYLFSSVTNSSKLQKFESSSSCKMDESRTNSKFGFVSKMTKGGFVSTLASDSSIDIKSESSIEMLGSVNVLYNGIYLRTDDINGKAHFERTLNGKLMHLFWSGNQWILHHDLDPSLNFDNLLGYAKVRADDPRSTKGHWNVKVGKTYKQSPDLEFYPSGEKRSKIDEGPQSVADREFFGVPRSLFPLYLAFMCDAVAVGLAMPLLPFYVMELGANALQLSMVISANYAAQMIGCIVMGQVSDIYGRRPVLCACLSASTLSFLAVSNSHTVVSVALARIIVGSFGGLVPVMQSCVSDVAPSNDRPKYLGRIMATFGFGFVLGPAISALLPGFSTRQKIRLAAALPFSGLLVSFFTFKETKKFSVIVKSDDKKNMVAAQKSPMKIEVLLLVLNGFLLMYAFATESLYAVFIKDTFGYGERALSTIFAVNGFFIGLFQVFFIKPMIAWIGKHATLAAGNIMLAAGLIGLAIVRSKIPHFILFTAHIVGYSIADTALASLITRYSPQDRQGRDLALNQSAQACARVLSPMIAGLLYERSKTIGILPIGALPFIAGALFPAIGVAIPTVLYIWAIHKKRVIN